MVEPSGDSQHDHLEAVPELHKPLAKKSDSLWMMTFSDLSFILMCFFALLLSMSTINAKKYDHVKGGFVEKKDGPVRDLSAIKAYIERAIKKKKLTNKASVKLDADGLAVEFKNKLLFRPGSANLNASFAKATGKVLKIIARSDPSYAISIEGHTDDTRTGRKSRYRSNWELSSARSISLLKLFRKKGVKSDRLRVIAYADTKPKVSIKKLKGKALKMARAQNRRVVVRLR